MASLAALATIIVDGVLLGGIYALAAVGLSLAWGTSRVINLAHGMFIVIGAYIAASLEELAGLHPAASIPVALGVGFAVGYLLYRYGLHRVAENDVMSLLATFGLSLVAYGVVQLLWGNNYVGARWGLGFAINIGGVYILADKLAGFAAASAMIAALWLLVARTGLGRAMRALAQSFEAARIIGIDVRRVGAIAFGLAVATAMAAGVVLTSYLPLINGDAGGTWLMIAFAVTALAGIGNLPGLIAAGVMLGVASSLAGFYLGPVMQAALPMILVAVVYAVKPEGILARVRARRV